jgi:hypothetical protein
MSWYEYPGALVGGDDRRVFDLVSRTVALKNQPNG